MTALRLAPAALAAVILGAHALRGGHPLAAAALAASPFALLLRERWVRPAFQTLLVAAAPVWVWTAVGIGRVRMEEGRPWVRMALILGGVAAFNLAAAALLRGPRMDAWFRSTQGPDSRQ